MGRGADSERYFDSVFAASYKDYTASVNREAQAYFAAGGTARQKSLAGISFSGSRRAVSRGFHTLSAASCRKKHHVSFYMTPASENPDTFFGQPVFVEGNAGGTADIYTRDVPWYIRASALGVDLHIHNHRTPVLKWIWAFLTVMTMVMIISAFILLEKETAGRQGGAQTGAPHGT